MLLKEIDMIRIILVLRPNSIFWVVTYQETPELSSIYQKTDKKDPSVSIEIIYPQLDDPHAVADFADHPHRYPYEAAWAPATYTIQALTLHRLLN